MRIVKQAYPRNTIAEFSNTEELMVYHKTRKGTFRVYLNKTGVSIYLDEENTPKGEYRLNLSPHGSYNEPAVDVLIEKTG